MAQRTVPDVETLKAVAHPIRTKLLALLRYEGPATASELGRRLDESSGSTSYHLRQLARYGFVEEVSQQPNRRDKRWRATHRFTSWSWAEFAGDPEGRQISDALERRVLASAVDAFQRWSAERDTLDVRWADAGGVHDDLLRLTPSQLTRLTEELGEVFARYRSLPPDAGDEPVGHVRVYQLLLPFAEIPL
ncbi:ArsR/SmtB family transcription factor [Sorangium sp. So ce861]|uniref:ArsR/SmtB family transcription factor n=1 Tax=Sorangium sp. So ce861 TaxID=3133323 RepID=UPI003F6217ED